MLRVSVNPDLLRWARQHTGLAQEDLAGKFPKLPDWGTGAVQPTLEQVEAFARARPRTGGISLPQQTAGRGSSFPTSELLQGRP